MLEVLLKEDLVLTLLFILFLTLLEHLVEFRGEERVGSLKFHSVEGCLSVFFLIIAKSLVSTVARVALALLQNGTRDQYVIVGTLSNCVEVSLLSLMLIRVLHK